MKIAIILIGIPNSGKSIYYKRFLFDHHLRISRKELKSAEAEIAVMEACFAQSTSFVVDNYNLSFEDRIGYINAARRNSYEVVAYYFPTTLELALERNRKRKRPERLLEEEIIACHKRLQPPGMAAGFDRVNHVIYMEGGAVDVRSITAG